MVHHKFGIKLTTSTLRWLTYCSRVWPSAGGWRTGSLQAWTSSLEAHRREAIRLPAVAKLRKVHWRLLACTGSHPAASCGWRWKMAHARLADSEVTIHCRHPASGWQQLMPLRCLVECIQVPRQQPAKAGCRMSARESHACGLPVSPLSRQPQLAAG